MLIINKAISLFLRITNPYALGSSFKYKLKKTGFQFEKKKWSIELYEFKTNLLAKNWNKKSELSKFSFKGNNIKGFADPFLIKENNCIYLFMEAIIDNKGEIWVSEVINKKIAEPKPVLKSLFHFSYPNVFQEHGFFFMIPETSQNGAATLYKAKSFPYEWEIEKDLYTGVSFVDTNFVIIDNVYFWFTYDLDLKLTRLFFSENIYDNWIEHPKSKFNCNRNAGNFIKINNKILRPVQIANKAYGEGVALMKITELSKEIFEEEIYDASFLMKKRGFRLDGVHHISFLEEENLVVIDGKNNNFYSIL